MSPTNFQVVTQRIGTVTQQIFLSGAEADGPSFSTRPSSVSDPFAPPNPIFAAEYADGIETPRSQMARLGYLRYLSPAHQYLDQFVHHLEDSPLTTDACKRCFREDCGARDWTQCSLPCGTCENDSHFGMVCPALYCTLSFWKSIGIDEQHVFQIRPERSQISRLVRNGVMHLLTRYSNHYRYSELLDYHFQYTNPNIAAFYGAEYSDGMIQRQQAVLRAECRIAKIDKAIADREWDYVLRDEVLFQLQRAQMYRWAMQDMVKAAGAVGRGRRRNSGGA